MLQLLSSHLGVLVASALACVPALGGLPELLNSLPFGLLLIYDLLLFVGASQVTKALEVCLLVDGTAIALKSPRDHWIALGRDGFALVRWGHSSESWQLVVYYDVDAFGFIGRGGDLLGERCLIEWQRCLSKGLDLSVG